MHGGNGATECMAMDHTVLNPDGGRRMEGSSYYFSSCPFGVNLIVSQPAQLLSEHWSSSNFPLIPLLDTYRSYPLYPRRK